MFVSFLYNLESREFVSGSNKLHSDLLKRMRNPCFVENCIRGIWYPKTGLLAFNDVEPNYPRLNFCREPSEREIQKIINELGVEPKEIKLNAPNGLSIRSGKNRMAQIAKELIGIMKLLIN